MKKDNGIALIITLLNEEERLERLLGSIDAQTMKPDEVVVCDGGSDDGTIDILEEWRKRSPVPVTVIRRPGANISAGRNTAIDACRAAIICVTDGGCVLDEAWLENISAPLRDEAGNCGVVFGRSLAVGESMIGRQFAALYRVLTDSGNPSATEHSSRSVAFRREVWDEAGGYPEWLTLAGEDTLFFIKAARVARCCIADDAVVRWRHGAETLTGVFRMHKRNSIGSGEANMWPARYLTLISLYLAAVGGLALSFISPLFPLLALTGLVFLCLRQTPALIRAGSFSWKTFTVAPLIMLVRDLGMICGYLTGLNKRARRRISKKKSAARVFWSILALLVILVAYLLVFHGGSLREYSGIFLTKKTESLTELYFSDYQSLPRILETGQEYEVGFTIVNREGERQEYQYRAVIIEDGLTSYLPVNPVELDNGEMARETISFIPTEHFADVTVEIWLLDRNQLIRYRAVT